MSPIDDELRSMFTSRAEVLTPAADPLVGIERRAKRIRRNRIAASVAGTALAVSAIAVAVPALVPDHDSGGAVVPAHSGAPSPEATEQPTTGPTPQQSAAGTTAYTSALDPTHPWPYRGSQAPLGNGTLATFRRDWSAKHPGSTLTPLFGQVYEPSQRPEVAFVATGGGTARWGVVTSGDAGSDFLTDRPLSSGTTALLAALPGDGVPRLLVLAAPSTGDIGYAARGTAFASVPMTAPGVAFHALEGDTSADAVRVLDGNGDTDHPVFEGPAPDAVSTTGGTPESVATTAPAETSSAPTLAARYAFDPAKPWAYRGTTQDGTGDITSADRKAFVTAHGEVAHQQDTSLYVVHLSATTDVAVVLHARSDGNWVSFTAHDDNGTHQVTYQPTRGEDILSAYIPLTASTGLLVGVTSDQAANLVLQTGSRAEVGGSRTAGIWDWAPQADAQARLATFASGDAEPYSSQPAT